MEVFIITFVVLVLCFAGIAIRVILKKDKEFRGTCASNNPLLQKEDGTCGFCGQKVAECPEDNEKKDS